MRKSTKRRAHAISKPKSHVHHHEKPLSMSGGLVQYRMTRSPSQRDLAQIALVATTCARNASRLSHDFGSHADGCAIILRDRIGGNIIRGEFNNGGPGAIKHAWVEKDGLVYDAAFNQYSGSASFLVVPRDSPYAREHYRPAITVPEQKPDMLSRYLGAAPQATVTVGSPALLVGV